MVRSKVLTREFSSILKHAKLIRDQDQLICKVKFHLWISLENEWRMYFLKPFGNVAAISHLWQPGTDDLVLPERLLILRQPDALDQPLGRLVNRPVVHLALPPDVPKVLDSDLGVLVEVQDGFITKDKLWSLQLYNSC